MSKSQPGHVEQHHQTTDLRLRIPDRILQGEHIASEYVIYWNFVWITFLWKWPKINP